MIVCAEIQWIDNMKKLAAICFTTSVLLGCLPNEPEQPITRNYTGEWQTQCRADNEGYVIQQLSLSNESGVYVQEQYSDANCSEKIPNTEIKEFFHLSLAEPDNGERIQSPIERTSPSNYYQVYFFPELTTNLTGEFELNSELYFYRFDQQLFLLNLNAPTEEIVFEFGEFTLSPATDLELSNISKNYLGDELYQRFFNFVATIKTSALGDQLLMPISEQMVEVTEIDLVSSDLTRVAVTTAEDRTHKFSFGNNSFLRATLYDVNSDWFTVKGGDGFAWVLCDTHQELIFGPAGLD